MYNNSLIPRVYKLDLEIQFKGHVSSTDIEAIFQEMKEKYESLDEAFEEEQLQGIESKIIDKRSP